MNHIQSKANAIASITGPRAGGGSYLQTKSAPTKSTPEQVADDKAQQDSGSLPDEMTKGKNPNWAKLAGLFAILLLGFLFITGKVKF